MYIISKNNKDYYDGVVGTMGIDKTIIYNREIIEFGNTKFPDFLKTKSYWFRKNNNPFTNLSFFPIIKNNSLKVKGYSHFIIGFCGKLYIGFKLYKTNNKVKLNYNNELISNIIYDFNIMKSILKPKTYGGNVFDNDYNYIVNYDPIQIFRNYNMPVFIYDSNINKIHYDNFYHSFYHPVFIINPLLKDYEFYKIFNSFQAFQEISMFIGGVLGNKEKEIIEIADKYKIAQHGFDKWSFRKEPEVKK